MRTQASADNDPHAPAGGAGQGRTPHLHLAYRGKVAAAAQKLGIALE